MALLIVASALVGAVISFGLTVALRPAKPLSRKNRTLLDDAASFIRTVRNPTDITRVEVLSDPSQQAADRWLARYNKEFS